MTLRQTVLPDGRRLAWRESGEGPPLVLLHGWGSSSLAFTPLVAPLAAHFRLLLPDLPGHGDSAPVADGSLEGLVADLDVWLGQVCTGPVCLGGWSLGGMIAIQLASGADQRFSGLLLLATTPRFTRGDDWPHGLPSTQIRAMRRNLSRRFAATLDDFFELTLAGDAIDAEGKTTLRTLSGAADQQPDAPSAAAMLALLESQDQRALLGRLALPTLIVHGGADRIVPPGAAQALAAATGSARLQILSGVGHAPFWSRPQDVANLIIAEVGRWCR
ncbi:MAG: alpha/beta fold hydrolase [Desulfuromonadales bacterium]|nr:alpha/beta fold hydrolase [Desulfuromonadales bacterium]